MPILLKYKYIYTRIYLNTDNIEKRVKLCIQL